MTHEKMIQHDVTEQKSVKENTEPTTLDEIDKIPRDTDDFQKIPISINLPYFLLKELSNNIKKSVNDDLTLNGLLEERLLKWNKEFKLEHHVGSLSFKGSFPRIDVLKRLKISFEFETWPEFPRFKRNHLEVIIRKIIGSSDPRTFNDYLKCIITFIETKNGGKIGFYGDYDMYGFREVIEEALTRSEKGEIKKI